MLSLAVSAYTSLEPLEAGKTCQQTLDSLPAERDRDLLIILDQFGANDDPLPEGGMLHLLASKKGRHTGIHPGTLLLCGDRLISRTGRRLHAVRRDTATAIAAPRRKHAALTHIGIATSGQAVELLFRDIG